MKFTKQAHSAERWLFCKAAKGEQVGDMLLSRTIQLNVGYFARGAGCGVSWGNGASWAQRAFGPVAQ